ncbi:MAG: EscU/YscU/HrcU family type III secretion system export apparatus switch protein [Tranquillimonas sp.]
MSEEDKSSKTEEPTERKLRKARDKGDVPSSRETGNMMTVFSLFVLTVFMLPQIGPGLVAALQAPLQSAGQIGIGSDGSGLRDIGGILRRLSGELAVAIGPALLVMLIAAVFGVLIQGETTVAAERMRPKISKLSPLSGLKRLAGPDALVEFAKNVAKVLVIGAITVVVARQTVGAIWHAPGFVPEDLPDYTRRAVGLVLIAATVFLVPVAIIDILWKRSQWMKKQRMSMRELRDEHKDSEGDPQIKARRADIRRQRARQRIAASVPTASVILTNPTHYAVALRYQQGVDTAPVCVAKGVDLMAQQIRLLARENDIPIVENRPLARALHDSVEVDAQVPTEHWQAVAEIIGYVMDLRRNLRRKPPEGSQLRDDP